MYLGLIQRLKNIERNLLSVTSQHEQHAKDIRMLNCTQYYIINDLVKTDVSCATENVNPKNVHKLTHFKELFNISILHFHIFVSV